MLCVGRWHVEGRDLHCGVGFSPCVCDLCSGTWCQAMCPVPGPAKPVMSPTSFVVVVFGDGVSHRPVSPKEPPVSASEMTQTDTAKPRFLHLHSTGIQSRSSCLLASIHQLSHLLASQVISKFSNTPHPPKVSSAGLLTSKVSSKCHLDLLVSQAVQEGAAW